MTSKLVNLLNSFLEDEDLIDLEQVRKMAFETTVYLESLEDLFRSGAPQAKEAALAAVFEVKEFLNGIQTLARASQLTVQDRELIGEMLKQFNFIKIG